MGEELTIEARHERGYPVVTVAGEIDVATAARLRERLFELAAGGRPLVTDLNQVRFIDSAGLAALVGAANRADRARRQPACGLRPAADPPAVPADRAGPPASAGPHPGRGPGRRDDGPAHARLAGGSGGPDRRPGSRGARTTRPCGPEREAPASWPASGPLPPGWEGPWGRAGFGLCSRGRRPSNTHVRPVTGLALAHLRDLLARHGIEPSQGIGPCHSGTSRPSPTARPGSRRGPRVVNRTLPRHRRPGIAPHWAPQVTVSGNNVGKTTSPNWAHQAVYATVRPC